MSDMPDVIYAGYSKYLAAYARQWDDHNKLTNWPKYLAESIAITKEDHQKAMIELLESIKWEFTEEYVGQNQAFFIQDIIDSKINSLKQRMQEKSDERI